MDKPGAVIGRILRECFADSPGGIAVFGEHDQVASAAGPEKLGGIEAILHLIQNALYFGRIGAAIQKLIEAPALAHAFHQ